MGLVVAKALRLRVKHDGEHKVLNRWVGSDDVDVNDQIRKWGVCFLEEWRQRLIDEESQN